MDGGLSIESNKSLLSQPVSMHTASDHNMRTIVPVGGIKIITGTGTLSLPAAGTVSQYSSRDLASLQRSNFANFCGTKH